MSKRPILVVDGMNLFMRHFVANPSMSSHGNHIGGVVGFMKSLAYLCDRVGPKEIIISWEGGGSARRRAIYKDYKNGRRPQKLNRYYGGEIPDTVQNRDDEISMLISLLRHTPAKQIYIEDCEADDVIGYIAKWCFSDDRIVIVSSDKDLYQLLSSRIIQWSPGQKSFVTLKTVREKFKIHPNNFCVAKSFVGDSSDNISGVPYVGFSSLSKRFPELADSTSVSVSEIIEISKKRLEKRNLKIYTNITENIEIAKRNWRLMYLDTNNLSASQIKKINYSIADDTLALDKISLIRDMIKYGINNFDADSFFASLRATIRRE